MHHYTTIEALQFWQRVLRQSLSTAHGDLTSRQMAILLEIYLGHGPHSVKSLARELGISKPAVCRAVDALSAAGLVKRKKDEIDRRNVSLQRTIPGSVYLSDFADLIAGERRQALPRLEAA